MCTIGADITPSNTVCAREANALEEELGMWLATPRHFHCGRRYVFSPICIAALLLLLLVLLLLLLLMLLLAQMLQGHGNGTPQHGTSRPLLLQSGSVLDSNAHDGANDGIHGPRPPRKHAAGA